MVRTLTLIKIIDIVRTLTLTMIIDIERTGLDVRNEK